MRFKGNYIYTILLAVLFFFSCQENKQTDKEENKQELQENKQETKETTSTSSANFLAIVYRNVLNEVTDINLTIKKGGTFIYYQAPLSKPSEGEYKTTTLHGMWTEKNNWIVLQFEDKDVKANTIFTSENRQENVLKVIDDTTVEINKEQEEISILGIRCLKSII